jgi:hypothetical protein
VEVVTITTTLRFGPWIPAYAGMTCTLRFGPWIPAYAGMTCTLRFGPWIPAYAGMTQWSGDDYLIAFSISACTQSQSFSSAAMREASSARRFRVSCKRSRLPAS